LGQAKVSITKVGQTDQWLKLNVVNKTTIVTRSLEVHLGVLMNRPTGV